MEKVTLITCTGARPEAFTLCERWIKNQTYRGEIEWIVVDDCEPATVCTMGQKYVRGPKPWRPGINTQRYNMEAALPHITGDFIFIIEDDDYYGPSYIEAYTNLLKFYSAVGEGNAKYYNILDRSFKEWNNYQHASLCQTGIRKELLPRLDEAINSGELFIDMALWRIFRAQNLKPFIFANQDYVVGIKGLPGRHGIGAGHFPQEKGFVKDPGFAQLKGWCGVNAQPYIEIAMKPIVRK